MRHFKTAGALIFGTLVILLSLTPAQQLYAQDGTDSTPLTLEVRAGFDGYIESGQWVPVTVTAANDGDDITGELRVSAGSMTGSTTDYTRPIDLPQGSRKQVTFYVADYSAVTGDFIVELVELNGRVLATSVSRVETIRETTLLIGIWSDTPQDVAGASRVSPSSRATRVALLSIEDFPDEARGWISLDVLIIANTDTGILSSQQREALSGWLHAGGKLIIVGGLNYQRTLAGLGDVTPVYVDGTSTQSINDLLDSLQISSQESVAMPLAAGDLAPGAQVILRAGDLPLLVYQKTGLGSVSFLAADTGLEPLHTIASGPELWTYLLSLGEARPLWGYGINTQNSYAARNAITDVPGISLPSALQLCGFLALYVVLIGPVNYVVLTRLKRRELAWLTVPVLIVVFSAMAYVTGFQLRGTRVIVHRLALIQSWPDSDTAQVDGIMGVWSPRRARYDLSFGQGFMAKPLTVNFGGGLTQVGRSEVEYDESVTLRDVRVDIGSIQPFVVAGSATAELTIASDLRLVEENGDLRLQGQITNTSDLSLENATIVFAGTAVRVGDIPAGETTSINEFFSVGRAQPLIGNALDPFPSQVEPYYYYDPYSMTANIAGMDCYSMRGAERRCQFFDSLRVGANFGTNLYLIGWSDTVPYEVEVRDARTEFEDLGLYIVQLVYEPDDDIDTVTEIPPGLMSWQAAAGTDPYLTPYDSYIYDQQILTFRFQPLPVVGDVNVSAITIHIEGQGATNETEGVPDVALFNHLQKHWQPIDGIRWGDNFVGNAAPFIDSTGSLLIRISVDNDFGTSLTRTDVTYHTSPQE